MKQSVRGLLFGRQLEFDGHRISEERRLAVFQFPRNAEVLFVAVVLANADDDVIGERRMDVGPFVSIERFAGRGEESRDVTVEFSAEFFVTAGDVAVGFFRLVGFRTAGAGVIFCRKIGTRDDQRPGLECLLRPRANPLVFQVISRVSGDFSVGI